MSNGKAIFEHYFPVHDCGCVVLCARLTSTCSCECVQSVVVAVTCRVVVTRSPSSPVHCLHPLTVVTRSVSSPAHCRHPLTVSIAACNAAPVSGVD